MDRLLRLAWVGETPYLEGGDVIYKLWKNKDNGKTFKRKKTFMPWTLGGPTRENLAPHPLAALSLNRKNIFRYDLQTQL